MTDQQQPQLTLNEELDVLEAVYKIGKEKGLELLRPEQVKKLRDAGRMNIPLSGYDKTAKRYKVLPSLMSGLLLGLDEEYQDELDKMGWESATSDEKDEIRQVLFKRKYGVFPDYFATILGLGGSGD